MLPSSINVVDEKDGNANRGPASAPGAPGAKGPAGAPSTTPPFPGSMASLMAMGRSPATNNNNSNGAAGVNTQNLSFLNTMSSAPAPTPGQGGGAGAGNNQQLLSVLSSLVGQRGNSAAGSTGLGSQLQQQQSQSQLPAGFNGIGFLPQLLQQQQQQAAKPAAAAPPPAQQHLGGLGYQQLVALLLQQQQQQQQPRNKPNALDQALGSLGAPAAAPGLDVSSLLTILASNNSQKAAAVPTAEVSVARPASDRAESAREIALRKKCKLLPCRARGMPMDHNIHTAFFEVPENAAHGSELVCSYPACRNSGVRFLYCHFCDAAISRRGFKTKHVHEDLRQPGQAAAAVAAGLAPPKAGSLSSLSLEKKHKKNGESRISLETSSQSSDSSVEGDGVGAAAGKKKKSGSWGFEEGRKAKKQKSGEPLRMKELKKDWTQLLEESRQHCGASDAETKRKEWLAKCETIYDEYVTLAKPDSPSEA